MSALFLRSVSQKDLINIQFLVQSKKKIAAKNKLYIKYSWKVFSLKCCPNVGFFRSVFSRIWTESGDLRSKSPYSVQIQENMYQKNSVFEHFQRSGAKQNSK